MITEIIETSSHQKQTNRLKNYKVFLRPKCNKKMKNFKLNIKNWQKMKVDNTIINYGHLKKVELIQRSISNLNQNISSRVARDFL